MIKWIGQHIWDLISRFRNKVYLEDLDTSSETNILVVDSDGLVTKNTGAGDDTTFTLTADSGSDQTIDDGSTLDVAGGTDLETTVGATDTVTVDHSSVNKTTSVYSASPAHGGTFHFVKSMVTSATGHVTAVNTETITLPADNNTQLTQEQVEDYVGGMVTGNTESGITVTYEDGDGTLDFDVQNNQDESFTFFALEQLQTSGTSTGTIFQSDASQHNKLATAVTLGSFPVRDAIQASIKAIPGPRILNDGKLIISGTADVTGTLSIWKFELCAVDAALEGAFALIASHLMGTFNFTLEGAQVPVCVDIGLSALAYRTVTDEDIIIPIMYNMGSGEENWDGQGICTLTWKIE